MLEQIPDVAQLDAPAAFVEPVPEAGEVLTTTAESAAEVPLVTEPAPEGAAEVMPQPEQVMLTRSVQKLAQKLLDTNTTATTISWQQDGQQYSARVMRQPAADSTGLEQVIAEIMTSKDGKRMKTRLSLKRLAFSHFTQLVNNWDPNIQMHDDVIDGRFHSNTEFGLTTIGGVKPQVLRQGDHRRVDADLRQLQLPPQQGRVPGRRRNQDGSRHAAARHARCASSGGDEGDRRVFADDTRIIFNPDGSYVWRLANGEGALQRAEPSQKPRYLIGEKDAKLYVRGTVVRHLHGLLAQRHRDRRRPGVPEGSAPDRHFARLPGADLRPRHPHRRDRGHRARRSERARGAVRAPALLYGRQRTTPSRPRCSSTAA